MPEIVHFFVVNETPETVFPLISTADGLNTWWTKTCEGRPLIGEKYKLGFGQDYQWEAVVTEIVDRKSFEMRMTKSDTDWNKSILRFELTPGVHNTSVRFFHHGWPDKNEHFHISNYCWAMYLRLLKLRVETGLIIPYDKRLDV